MLPDGLRHQEIIQFTRTVNSCRTINNIRETGNTLNIKFSLKLAKTISSIWHRDITGFYRRIIFFAYRSEYTQRTDIDELLRNHIQRFQGINKVFGLEIIHIIKSILIRTFRDSRTMDDIVKLIIGSFMSGELGTQFIGMSKVQFQKMDLPVLQVLFAAGGTNPRPHTKLSF